MNLLVRIAAALLVTSLSANAFAQNIMDELDPYDPNIEEQLNEMDRSYQEDTGLSPFMMSWMPIAGKSGCKREECKIWLRINKEKQKAYLYIDGDLNSSWLVSTGIAGRRTPEFDQHPNGRIYDEYTSTKYPGGDYKGMGNMPYAVFITGGFAIHGTGESNWKKLGTRASHGCIRMHPEKAYKFNRLVRKYGIYKVWITVE
ncbi:hypothetical protein D3C72_1296740 [compost metagenome]